MLALALSLMLFSLAGIPLTAGFIGKYYILAAGVDAGRWTLVLVMVASSVIGLFVYLRVIGGLSGAAGAPTEPTPRGSRVIASTLIALTAALLWLGIAPSGNIGLLRPLVSAVTRMS